ncbi:MAG: hypothetical protein QOJ56_2511, partial [Mycobacterium sp.]|nr:hypothetical protein [Mycobacterium sp.]
MPNRRQTGSSCDRENPRGPRPPTRTDVIFDARMTIWPNR